MPAFLMGKNSLTKYSRLVFSRLVKSLEWYLRQTTGILSPVDSKALGGREGRKASRLLETQTGFTECQ